MFKIIIKNDIVTSNYAIDIYCLFRLWMILILNVQLWNKEWYHRMQDDALLTHYIIQCDAVITRSFFSQIPTKDTP